MRTAVITQEGDEGVEIFALKKDLFAENPVIKIRPGTIKNKLMRHLHYNIERELYTRKVEAEFDRYGDLQSQLVTGFITNITNEGSLDIVLERELLFERIMLYATCPVRYQPIHERGTYKVDDHYAFYVRKIRPGQERGMPRLEIKLDRTSPRIPEGLIRKKMEATAIGLPSEINHFKCVKRVCGAFSHIVAEKRINKEIIKSVSRELKENVFVKYGVERHV
jgi:hypothetical protein